MPPPRPTTFKQDDVKRACKGVLAAGLAVGRVEIDREGKIVVIPGSPAFDAKPVNDWD